jgi:hypothetical protein
MPPWGGSITSAACQHNHFASMCKQIDRPVHFRILYLLDIVTKLSLTDHRDFLDVSERHMRSAPKWRLGYENASCRHFHILRFW